MGGVKDGLKDRIGAFVQSSKPVPRVVPAATKDPVLVRQPQSKSQPLQHNLQAELARSGSKGVRDDVAAACHACAGRVIVGIDTADDAEGTSDATYNRSFTIACRGGFAPVAAQVAQVPAALHGRSALRRAASISTSAQASTRTRPPPPTKNLRVSRSAPRSHCQAHLTGIPGTAACGRGGAQADCGRAATARRGGPAAPGAGTCHIPCLRAV